MGYSTKVFTEKWDKGVYICSDVAVKAKPECCSEQNRNREKRLVERASVHDCALKKTIIEG
jgi:hypothetical protein